MMKPELVLNKIFTVLLVFCSLPIMFWGGDATATVFMLIIDVPLFFAKESCLPDEHCESEVNGMSESCEHKRRYNAQLDFITKFEDCLSLESPIILF